MCILPSFVVVVFFVFLKVFHCLLWEIRVALPGSDIAASKAALPIPISMCSYLCVSKQWYTSCQCLGFLTRAQLLLHAFAHGGCTVRESALRVDSGRKIPWRTGDSKPGRKIPWPTRGSNPLQYCALAFQWDALPTGPFPSLY